MARLVALEWNEHEARGAVANVRGSQLVFEQAFSVDLRPPGEDDKSPEASIGQQIAAALSARGVSRGETLVAVGRADIELRQFSMPPAPDEELPDMVRFQAVREFNALDDRWPIDFLPLDSDPEKPRSVLAAAIDPKLVAGIEKTCEAAGLKPHRMILRPCAAASLLRRASREDAAPVQLLVDLLGNEADLTVMLDGTVVFLRSARLPTDPLDEAADDSFLTSEIRRTMAAAHNQLGDRRIQQIILCGSGPRHTALAQQIQEKADKPTELFDPFADLRLGGELSRGLPDHPGRFAPLLGLLLDEHESVPHAIDFLNPRKRPAPPSKRKRYVMAGLAAFLLVGALIGWKVFEKRWLTNEVRELTQDVKAAEPRSAEAILNVETANWLAQWKDNTVVWLDELYRVSIEAPPAEDLMFTAMDLKQDRSNQAKGRVTANALARDAEVVKPTEQALRDPTHRVIAGDNLDDRSRPRYTVRFDFSILVDPGEQP